MNQAALGRAGKTLTLPLTDGFDGVASVEEVAQLWRTKSDSYS